MSDFTKLPTLAIDFLAPQKGTFDVLGSSMEGGRNGLGESQTIGMAGGGIVSASFEECMVKNPEHFEYINWLGALLTSRTRAINVPVVTDWWGPFPKIGKLPTPIIKGLPHSDGALFSDTSGYSQSTVWGEVVEDANLGAGQIKMQVFGLARALRWSDWFSIFHEGGKGWRAYRYWQVLYVSDDADPIYTLAIQPTLRAAVVAGTRVEFARPLFAAKLKSQSTIPNVIEAFFVTKQDLNFVEAW